MPQSEDHLFETIRGFAREETKRMALAVITRLSAEPACELFPDIRARNAWDELCWGLQEGPFDGGEWYGASQFGSVSDTMDDMLKDLVDAEVEDLKPRTRTLLEMGLSFVPGPPMPMETSPDDMDQDDDDDDDPNAEIVERVLDIIRSHAAEEDLRLIGHNRGVALWEAIEWRETHIGAWLEAMDVACDFSDRHYDTLADPKADLSEMEDDAIRLIVDEVKALLDGTSLAGFAAEAEDDLFTLIQPYAREGLKLLHKQALGVLEIET